MKLHIKFKDGTEAKSREEYTVEQVKQFIDALEQGYELNLNHDTLSPHISTPQQIKYIKVIL
ncbi:hypothetical protein [Paenibacillus bouchesdurhonensis]|uniref:hypothetical protein n=1 Tax=Paenibacillus bouchesdurhonensis TaxID=1870990 RepID=UPI000DA60514|nr:hypothetical protein [Paenibacillus bouchesdurhonensis]